MFSIDKLPKPFEAKDLHGLKGRMVYVKEDPDPKHGDKGAECVFFVAENGTTYLIYEGFLD